MPVGFWDLLVVVRKNMTELEMLNAAACRSMRQIEEQTAKIIAESRELMCKVDAILARDPLQRHESV
jgi:hypothetical protein